MYDFYCVFIRSSPNAGRSRVLSAIDIGWYCVDFGWIEIAEFINIELMKRILVAFGPEELFGDSCGIPTQDLDIGLYFMLE